MKNLDELINFASIEDLKEYILAPYKTRLEKVKEVYIFGTKALGKQAYESCVKAGIKVSGYIDNDIYKRGKKINGVPIYQLSDILPSKDTLIIIATLNYWGDIEKQLRANKITEYIAYPILTLYNPEIFPCANMALDHIVDDLIINKQCYIQVIDFFGDELSKQVYTNIIKFRVSFDTKYLQEAYEMSKKYGEEYFDREIIKLSQDEVFIDGGAYKGETSLEFIKECQGKYKKIYVFEPDSSLLEDAKKTLKEYDNIIFRAAGLGKVNGEVRFNMTNDTGGRILDTGEDIVKIETLDALQDNQISFIKMDIEGAEIDAMEGARQLIATYKPKMAISAYHNPKDIWAIVEQAHEIYPQYKVYLRHYTSNCFETDLYFI